MSNDSPPLKQAERPARRGRLQGAGPVTRGRRWAPAALLGLALAMLGATGCRSIGPGTVARDRFDYSTGICESWKRQTLLNIVKLRYLDPPSFVDVGQIVSGYSLETSGSVGGQISSAGAIQGNSLLLGAQGKYTDRPTITYVPLTGNKFIRGLMTPLPPESVFFTIQSGWPADGVLFATVAEINGLKNQALSLEGVSPPDPGFMRVMQLMRKIQLTGALAMRIKQDTDKQQTTILTFRSKDIPQQTLDDIHELRGLLRLAPDAEELKLVYGGTSISDTEVGVLTRSLMQMMGIMACDVEVPPEDVAQGRAIPGWVSPAGNTGAAAQASAASGGKTNFSATHVAGLIRIPSAKTRPTDAFVTIQYRDRWFWIDDRDLRSKRAFSFMMMLFTLADTGEKESLPLITIPAQ